jgi:4-amino-4-deoxy-L-arabinose transferase-like glycosyltransferase
VAKSANARTIRRFWGAIPIALAIGLFALRACVTTPPRDRLAFAPADERDPQGTIAQQGSLLIARGGPVIVGFQSNGPARLQVGTREIIGALLVKNRIVLPAGPVAIRFAAAPDARLVWNPVGRRGDPEYVSASSLSPDPPGTARFGRDAGAAPADGAIALALLLLLVASLCMLARRRLAAVSRMTWLAMAMVFVVACVVRWIDLSGFGQTWDEDVNWAAGRNYVTNLLSLDARPSAWVWNFEHPPMMKYFAGIGAQFADDYGPARVLSAIWVALSCALLVPIGARLFRLRVGALAAAIAALLPPLVAHGQIVGHESPTVLWWSLGVLLALGVSSLGAPSPSAPPGAPARHRTRRIRLAWLGVVLGIAFASRFVNGLLGPLCLAIVTIQAPAGQRRRMFVEAGLGMPVVALATLYLVWPRLWLHPIAALQASFAKLSQTHSVEPFLGAMTNHPGPHYFLVYLVATLPMVVLVGVVAFIVRATRKRDERRSALIALAWFVIPLAVAASPVRQDGVRYVIPSVVVLAMLAAAGWDHVATVFERRWKHAFAAVSGALIIYLAITLIRIHPYYLDYFGEQVGGTGTVASHGWFETAWWGEGVDRAVDYVNANAPPRARVYRDCIEPVHLAWFRVDLWAPMAHSIDQADWIVTYGRQTHPCPIPESATRVFSVDADGAIMAEVWKR